MGYRGNGDQTGKLLSYKRYFSIVVVFLVLLVIFWQQLWQVQQTRSRQGRSSAVRTHRPHAHPRQGEEYLTTTLGNYFDPPLKMDGLLRKIEGGRLDAILPPIFGHSHASNLLELPDGALLLVWFSNGAEGGDGVGIVSSTLAPGALQWSRPAMVTSEPMRSAQNPVAFYEESGDVVRLLHTSQVSFEGQGTSEVRMVESHDRGFTWKAPVVVFSDPGAFVKNQLLRSADDKEWLLPMYYTPTGFLGHETQYSAVHRSSDGGRTWQKFDMEGTLGRCVQPTVVRLRSGRLRAWFRSRDADFIYVADSEDDGRTWSAPRATDLPNNNSGIQAAMLASGAVVMLFNNLQGPFSRFPLTAALSLDEGATWPHLRDLEPAAAAVGSSRRRLRDQEEEEREEEQEEGGKEDEEEDEEGTEGGGGEYSYPSVIQSRDGFIHISYTFRRESIRYARVTEEWIKKGATIGAFKGSAPSR